MRARRWQDYRASGGGRAALRRERLAGGERHRRCAARHRTVRGRCARELLAVIRAINASGKPVFALDVPSGLDADAGVARGEAVRAAATVTFVGLKTGLFVGDGPEFAGQVFFDDLELAPAAESQFPPRLTRITEAEIHAALPRRPRTANKGDFGRVLIVGSGSGMPGAARLAGEACLRVGAGLTTVAVAPENVARDRRRTARAHLPRHHGGGGARARSIERADVIAIGPGLGRSALGARGAGHGARLRQAAGGGCRRAQPARRGRRAARARLDPDTASGRGGPAARRRRSAMCRRTGSARSRRCSSGSAARWCSRAPARWWARRGARPDCASAAIPAWRPPEPGTCSPGRSPAFWRSVRTPGRRRASGCWCTPWPAMPRRAAVERGVLASDLARELHNSVNL